jgi:hypothetical protein
MIIPRLKGGLGNQMFTIAAAYAAARNINSEMFINYTIPHVGGQGSGPLKYKDTIYKNIQATSNTVEQVFNEPDWSYSPIPHIDNIITDGYFQSEKHFKQYSTEIKELFNFPTDIKNKITNSLTKIPKKLLSVHVRLGDYLNPGYTSTHFICNRDYYINALKHFDLNEYTIIVCTDDVVNYNKYINIENAILCNGKDELEDLYLLSQCDASILTNSSFSWWGAYLGKDKHKVCAPSKWFGPDGPKNYTDIYRDNWTIIDV